MGDGGGGGEEDQTCMQKSVRNYCLQSGCSREFSSKCENVHCTVQESKRKYYTHLRGTLLRPENIESAASVPGVIRKSPSFNLAAENSCEDSAVIVNFLML